MSSYRDVLFSFRYTANSTGIVYRIPSSLIPTPFLVERLGARVHDSALSISFAVIRAGEVVEAGVFGTSLERVHTSALTQPFFVRKDDECVVFCGYPSIDSGDIVCFIQGRTPEGE